MIYLLLGAPSSAKDEKIDALKRKHLTGPEALSFDVCILHGEKLSAADLKKSLMALPSSGGQYLVILRAIHKLSAQNKKIIEEYLRQPREDLVLIMDSDEASGAFLTKISKSAQIIRFASEKKKNIFDVTNAMQRGDAKTALKELSGLMEDGQHPLQLMGGLVWFWGKTKSRLSAQSYKKGLLVLQEADLNIKRSRLNPEQAVEITVVKLLSLLTC